MYIFVCKLHTKYVYVCKYTFSYIIRVLFYAYLGGCVFSFRMYTFPVCKCIFLALKRGEIK